MESFKAYIHTLLTHVNPYTNLTYADDPTIFAYESGNELAGPVWGDMDVPVGWVREIAAYVKSLAPKKLVVDGTYGVNQSHLGVGEVDIFSDHFYPLDITKLQGDLDLGKTDFISQFLCGVEMRRAADTGSIAVASVNKSYFAGEFDWVGSTDEGVTANGDSLVDWFDTIEKSPVAAGDAFWSLFGHDAPNCNVSNNSSHGAFRYRG